MTPNLEQARDVLDKLRRYIGDRLPEDRSGDYYGSPPSRPRIDTAELASIAAMARVGWPPNVIGTRP